MNRNNFLISVANKVIFTQVSLHVSFIGFIFMGDIFIILFIPVFLIGCLYILKLLIFDDNLCPNCNEYFFKKKGEFMNIGFSMYTKKCTNCGYKLKKELDFKDDLLEDRDENSKSEK